MKPGDIIAPKKGSSFAFKNREANDFEFAGQLTEKDVCLVVAVIGDVVFFLFNETLGWRSTGGWFRYLQEHGKDVGDHG